MCEISSLLADLRSCQVIPSVMASLCFVFENFKKSPLLSDMITSHKKGNHGDKFPSVALPRICSEVRRKTSIKGIEAEDNW